MTGRSPSWSDHCGWYDTESPPLWTGTRGVPRPAPTLELTHRATDQPTFASVVKRVDGDGTGEP